MKRILRFLTVLICGLSISSGLFAESEATFDLGYATLTLTATDGNDINVDAFEFEFRIHDFQQVNPPFRADPFYAVYIEFGDGQFYSGVTGSMRPSSLSDPQEIIINHSYEGVSFESRTYGGRVTLTPIKMDGDPPTVETIPITVPNTPHPGTPQPDFIGNKAIGIGASWDGGIAAEDILTIFPTKNNSPPATINMVFYYRSSDISPINPVSPNNYGRNPNNYLASPQEVGPSELHDVEGAAIEYYDRKLPWNVEVSTQLEYPIFLDMQAGNNLEDGGSIYLLAVAAPIGGSTTGILGSEQLILRTSSSRDPNGVTVVPDTIDKTNGPHLLTYTIDFSNVGSAPQDDITVSVKLPSELNASTFQHLNAYIRHQQKVIPNNPNPAITPKLEITEGVGGEITWEFTEANLLGLNQQLIDPRDSEGKIVFTIETVENLAPCDNFDLYADVLFVGNETITAGPGNVTCVGDGKSIGPIAGGFCWCLLFVGLLILLFLFLIYLSIQQKKSA